MISVAPDLRLGDDAATGTFAITGMRGVGKTNTAVVMVEQMIGHGTQVVVIDPTDVWYGLASNADGTGPGCGIYVFGDMRSGHADLQLEPGSGALIADVVVDEEINVVVSLRHLIASQQREWVRDFADRLYERKGEPEHRTAMHLVVDEAKEFVPQRGSTVCAEVLTRIVTLGRSSGLGCTLITQRPALVNKDVLSQCGTLVAMRTTYTHDRKALDDWIVAHDPGDRHTEFMSTLASLPLGVAWFWSPSDLNLFSRAEVNARTTFDSSATPQAGHKPLVPRVRSTADITVLGERMERAIQRTAETDPARLRARVAALEAELETERASDHYPAEPLIEQITDLTAEVQRLATDRDRWIELASTLLLNAHVDPIAEIAADLAARLNKLALFHSDAAALAEQYRQPPAVDPAAPFAPPPAPRRRTVRGPSEPTDPLLTGNGGPARMAAALAENPGGLTRSTLGTLAKLARKGGTFGAYLSRLKTAGYIVERDGRVYLTEAGIDAVGGPRPPRDPAEVRDYWRNTLGGRGGASGAQRMFDALVAAYPRYVTRADLAKTTGLTANAGTFGAYLSRLRTNELLTDGPDHTYRAHPNLFGAN